MQSRVPLGPSKFHVVVLVCLSFMDKVGFTWFPERITPIFKFFSRNKKLMIVGMITGYKVL